MKTLKEIHSFVSRRESEGLLSLLKTVLHEYAGLLTVTARTKTSHSAALERQDTYLAKG